MPKRQPNPNTPKKWDARWIEVDLPYRADPWARDRFTLVASLIPPDCSVLDVGAGPAHIRRYLKPGIYYVAQDFSPEALRRAGGNHILSGCTRIPVAEGSFDTVLALEILEHLDAPQRLIRECVRIASRQLIFSVPNNRLSPEEWPCHRAIYNADTFHQLLKDSSQFQKITYHTAPGNLVAQCFPNP
ncbi:MAG: class I SAM-dependent methyltransferase [Phycisphaerae bacterium]|nr:class I SAM-dependent methyltransferase [Phycisphaerae bacterium]